MNELQHFEIKDDHAEYRPVGDVSLSEAVQMVSSALALAREQHIRKLLVVTTGLTGFKPPLVVDRYEDALHLAEFARPHDRSPAQHADWLDREIAACSGPQSTVPAPVAAPQLAVRPAENIALEPVVALPDPVLASQQARRGCFIYLIIALVLIGAVLAAVFHFRYGDRPLLFMDRDASQAEAGR